MVSSIIQRKVKRIPTLKGKAYPVNPASLGEHIRKARVDRKLTQEYIAQLFGVSEDTITGWENERSIPHIHYYKELIAFLGYYPFMHETATLAGKILKFRQTNGLTHRQMGRKVGVNASTIAAWEKNENIPQANKLRKLLKIITPNTP